VLLSCRSGGPVPLAGGRLMLAGEACHIGLAGTVGGAWRSGEAAARAALAALA
jgi:monoamine oxidase